MFLKALKRTAAGYYSRGTLLLRSNDLLIALSCAVIVIVLAVLLGLHNDSMLSARLGIHAHFSNAKPLSIFQHWDGTYYINIAKHGYRTLLDAGFFPLYPLLIRALAYVTGSFLFSALAISWASLVGAIYFYIKIIRHLGLLDKAGAIPLAIAPFVLFPTAVFLLVTYTEGLFALLALASIYFAFTKRYVLVGLLVMLAFLTHITGAFLVVLDGMILLEEKLPVQKVAAAVAMGASGLLLFIGYSYLHFHDALAFLNSQTRIHGWLQVKYLHLLTSTTYLNALLAALLIVAAVYFWNKHRSFAVYSLLFLLIPLVGAQWGGFNRYVLMAFPIPIMAYQALKDTQTYVWMVVLTAIFWAYTVLQYAAGFISS